MLKKLTYSQNNGKDIKEISFENGTNIVKSDEIYSKFSILKEVKSYTPLKTSSEAAGDFIEFELSDGERTYFLTVYLDSHVYEFYNDLDVDQNLEDFDLYTVFKHSDFQEIFSQRLNEYDFGKVEEKAIEPQIDIEKEKKLSELNEKISVIEKELENSKQYDTISEELKKVKTDLDNLGIKITEYTIARERLTQAEQRKQNLGIFVNLDFNLFEKDLKTLNSEIKNKREQLEVAINENKSSQYTLQKVNKSPIIFGLLLILDLILSIGISFTAPMQAIVIGIFIGVILCIWYFFSGKNSSVTKTESTFGKDFELEIELIEKAKLDLLGMIGCDGENTFYERKAELQACDFEITQLKKTMDERFVGIDIEKLRIDEVQLKEKSKDLESKLEGDLVNSKLSSEDYLKKRRDLDTLKMDKIRTESEVNNFALRVAKQASNKPSLNPKLNENKQNLGLDSLEISESSIKSASMEDLYLGCIANKIENIISNKGLFPILFEDVFIFINDLQKIQKLVSFYSTSLQFVLLAKDSNYDSFGHVAQISSNDETINDSSALPLDDTTANIQ